MPNAIKFIFHAVKTPSSFTLRLRTVPRDPTTERAFTAAIQKVLSNNRNAASLTKNSLITITATADETTIEISDARISSQLETYMRSKAASAMSVVQNMINRAIPLIPTSVIRENATHIPPEQLHEHIHIIPDASLAQGIIQNATRTGTNPVILIGLSCDHPFHKYMNAELQRRIREKLQAELHPSPTPAEA